MNKTLLLSAASTAAILCAVSAFAQGSGFVTLDLTGAGAPAESEMDGDAMQQMLERDAARAKWIQERAKAKAPAIRPELVKDDAAKAEGKTVAVPVAPPDESRNGGRTFSSDQMRQIVERDRARAKAMGERVRAAQIEADAEKYLQEHPVDFTPGKTPEGWFDDLQAALDKGGKEKKPVLALFTGSDWCPPCQKLEKNVLLQPAFKAFAEKHLVLLFIDSPQKTQLAEKVRKQNEELSKRFSVEGVPTAIILSPDGKKALWTHVGYTPLFLEQLQNGVQGLEKDYPDTAKAVKDELEAEARAKEEARAEREKAEIEEFERRQREAGEAAGNRVVPGSGVVNPAVMNPWGAGRLNPGIQPDPELLRELDKNGPVMGPDVLPHGGPAPYRPAVKRD